MEKTDDQIAREREAVASMKGAQANMKASLDRILSLEYALSNAVSALRQMKHYTPTGLYISHGAGGATVGQYIDEALAKANKVLGA